MKAISEKRFLTTSYRPLHGYLRDLNFDHVSAYFMHWIALWRLLGEKAVLLGVYKLRIFAVGDYLTNLGHYNEITCFSSTSRTKIFFFPMRTHYCTRLQHGFLSVVVVGLSRRKAPPLIRLTSLHVLMPLLLLLLYRGMVHDPQTGGTLVKNLKALLLKVKFMCTRSFTPSVHQCLVCTLPIT